MTAENASPQEDRIRDAAIAALRMVYDPEIPINIYDLGLVYAIEVRDGAEIFVRMTLTAPGCPVAPRIVSEVQTKLISLPGVIGAEVELVWDPPWTRERLSEAARLALGLSA